LHCMAHARRYFKEAADNDQARSAHALQAFQDIYEIERQIKDLPVAERKKLRRKLPVNYTLRGKRSLNLLTEKVGIRLSTSLSHSNGLMSLILQVPRNE